MVTCIRWIHKSIRKRYKLLTQLHLYWKLYYVFDIVSEEETYLIRVQGKKNIPALDSMCGPSSSSANEQTNEELGWDIQAPSPEIFTLTVVSSSSEFFNCKQISQHYKMITHNNKLYSSILNVKWIYIIGSKVKNTHNACV